MIKRSLWGAVVVAGLLVAMSGCASAPQAKQSVTPVVGGASETPSASPTPSPKPPVIVLDAAALSIEDESGKVIDSYPYANGATDAITRLTGLLGTPTSNYAPPGGCWTDMTTVKWPQLQMMYYGQDAATTKLFLLNANRTPSTTVPVESPHGARIGDSWSAFLPNVSGHLRTTAQYNGQTLSSVVDAPASDNPRAGTIVSAEDDVITTIAAPSSLDADC